MRERRFLLRAVLLYVTGGIMSRRVRYGTVRISAGETTAAAAAGGRRNVRPPRAWARGRGRDRLAPGRVAGTYLPLLVLCAYVG